MSRKLAECRRLCAAIDDAARRSGAYESERAWTNETGALVYDDGFPRGADVVTAKLLADIPGYGHFFTGWRGPRALHFLRRPPLQAIVEAMAWRGYHSKREWIRGLSPRLADLGTRERMSILGNAGILNRLPQYPTILEIGGGYGALALAIKRAVPDATYVIVDLPRSLCFSACYLATRQRHDPVVVHEGGKIPLKAFAMVLNTKLDAIDGTPIDLAINTLSFAEMPEAVVDRYAAFIRRNLRAGGSLFEQNHDNTRIPRANFCDPAAVLARHFPRCHRIPGGYMKGTPRVWSG